MGDLETPRVFWNERDELVKDGVTIGRIVGRAAFFSPCGADGEEIRISPHDPNTDVYPDADSAKLAIEMLGQISTKAE